MSYANYNQIVFSEEAYNQIIDLVNKPDLIDNFIEYKNILIKHDKRINIYQYKELSENYINSEPSTDLIFSDKLQNTRNIMKSFIKRDFDNELQDEISKIEELEFLNTFAELVCSLYKIKQD